MSGRISYGFRNGSIAMDHSMLLLMLLMSAFTIAKLLVFSQVNSVVNGIQTITKSKKLPLIVLHRSRVNGGPAKLPHNQKLLEVWQNAGALYATPPGSNDDW
ncbi:hypothetical protein ACQ4PT_022908 [Festuca glaucescens]